MTDFPRGDTMMLPFVLGEVMDEPRRRSMVAQYDGSIAYFDAKLGGLLAELADRGFLDNTLVVLMSDHGEEFYDHLGGDTVSPFIRSL